MVRARAPRTLLPVVLAGVLLAPSGAGAGALEPGCRPTARPAATLLFPYFETDLDSFPKPTTLIEIVNRRTDEPILAHVTLWTDWAVPTGGFEVFLGPGELLPISLRDLLASGEAPETGPGASAFPGCADILGGRFAAPSSLQRAHTGREVAGSCLGSPRREVGRAVGFVTVDVVRRCGGPATPAGSGYFTGDEPKAATDNVLWGNYYLIEASESFAQGETAVHVVADPDAFDAGDVTFYAPWVDSSGADGRAPLPSEWRARYLERDRNEASELLVWRAPVDPTGSGVACGTTPAWVPLERGGDRGLGRDRPLRPAARAGPRPGEVDLSPGRAAGAAGRPAHAAGRGRLVRARPRPGRRQCEPGLGGLANQGCRAVQRRAIRGAGQRSLPAEPVSSPCAVVAGR